MGIIETIKMLAEEEGFEKGFEKAKITFIKSLLKNTDLDHSKIAEICDVPEELVRQINEDQNTLNNSLT